MVRCKQLGFACSQAIYTSSLQYAKTEGEKSYQVIRGTDSMFVITSPSNSQVIFETDLAFYVSYDYGNKHQQMAIPSI